MAVRDLREAPAGRTGRTRKGTLNVPIAELGKPSEAYVFINFVETYFE